MPSSIDATLNAILDVDNRRDLDRVIKTVNVRRGQLAGELAASLRIGDRVRIVGPIKPRYIAKQTGVVAAPATSERVQVRLDHPETVGQRFIHSDGTVLVPSVNVEFVARAEDTAQETGGETVGEDPAQPTS
jgi:hypothetical protein